MPRGWIEGIKARVERVEAWLLLSSRLSPGAMALLAMLAMELILLAGGARDKPFWYDELFTYHLSSMRPFSAMWEALRGGADPMTPVYMSLSWAAACLPGDPHITVRLLSIVGYLMALGGTYLIVARRFSGVVAMMAVLLVALSPFRSYGMEARPYALLVGVLAVAAASWQRIGERRAAMAVFAVAMPLAASAHYYAALAIGVMGCAEAVYAAGRKRVRWMVWAVLGVSVAVVVWMLPFARAARQVYGQSFWAKPDLSQFARTYMTYLGLDINWALALLALATMVLPAYVAIRWRLDKHAEGFSSEEMALAYALLMYPAAAVAMAIVAGAGYTPRYGWPAILGLAMLLAVVVRAIGNKWMVWALAAALGLAFTAQVAKDLGKAKGMVEARNPTQRSSPAGLIKYAAQYPDHALVVGDGISYLELFSYADADLKRRMVQLTDPAEALRLTGEATVDLANGKLAPIIGLRIEERGRFLAEHGEFVLYGTQRNSAWVTRHLLENGYHPRLLGEDGGVSYYLVSGR
jgi:hypothetical protein